MSETAVDTRPMKRRADSAAETTRILWYFDINGQNRLFGGQLMLWIDEAASITATRHCGCNVTTACVDSLEFKKGAYLNDFIVIASHLTYVGNSSMEVRVDSYVEDRKTGMRSMINHAYLTMVCVDENDRPQTVPFGLIVESEEEKMEYEDGEKAPRHEQGEAAGRVLKKRKTKSDTRQKQNFKNIVSVKFPLRYPRYDRATSDTTTAVND